MFKILTAAMLHSHGEVLLAHSGEAKGRKRQCDGKPRGFVDALVADQKFAGKGRDSANAGSATMMPRCEQKADMPSFYMSALRSTQRRFPCPRLLAC